VLNGAPPLLWYLYAFQNPIDVPFISFMQEPLSQVKPGLNTGLLPPISLWRGWLSAVRLARLLDREWQQTIAMAIEAFVSGVEPRLRAIRQYDRRLWPVMAATFDYLDELVERLPAAVDLDRSAWQLDPAINAFFASPQDLSLLLAQNQALADFFQLNPLASEAFALLILTRCEKQVFGLSLVDDVLRRDVAQTRVSFSDPQLLYPSATEEATRRAARQCAVALYFTGMARDHLARIRASQQSLEFERLMVQIRHRDLRRRARHGDRDGSLTRGVYAAEARLAALEEEGGAPHLGRYNPLAVMFDEAWRLLANHRHQLRLVPLTLRVDRLGIKHEAPSTAGTLSHELSLLECTTEKTRQVITLVRCTRREFSGSALFLPDSAA